MIVSFLPLGTTAQGPPEGSVEGATAHEASEHGAADSAEPGGTEPGATAPGGTGHDEAGHGESVHGESGHGESGHEGGEAHASDSSTVGVLLLILGVGAAYLLAHAVVDRMQRRFLVMTGAEYVLLGMLIGPVVAPWLRAFEDLDPILPLVALAAGWVGLLRGMELDLREVSTAVRTRGTGRIALLQAVLTGGLVATGSWFFFSTQFEADTETIALGAGVLGCVSATASVRPIEVLGARYALQGGLSPVVRRIAALSDLIAIIAFGVLVCVFHPSPVGAAAKASPTEWVVISVVLGVALGVLFTPFLGGDDSDQGRFLGMAGIITFASGAAYFLQISPIFVNLCLGMVLVNWCRRGPEIRRTLEGTRAPMALMLLVFAGALVRIPPLLPTLVLTGGFVALRLLGKVVGCWLGASGSDVRSDVHRGLLGHGDVTVAIAVAYRVFHLDGEIPNAVFMAVLDTRVLHDLFAPRALRSLLVDVGDIREEPSATQPPSDGSAGGVSPQAPQVG